MKKGTETVPNLVCFSGKFQDVLQRTDFKTKLQTKNFKNIRKGSQSHVT